MKVRIHLNVLVVDVYKHGGVILVSEQKYISVLFLLFTLRRCQFPFCTASNDRMIGEMDRIWTEPIITYSTFCLLPGGNYKNCQFDYRNADKSLARPASRCILFDGENI